MNRWFGNAEFYKKVFIVAIPLLIQQMITSLVNLLDNIMVGQVGTLAMSGVSIASQLITIFNLAVFGSVAACSIFGAQFFGRNDMQGMRYCLRFKLIIEIMISIISIIVFLLFSKPLIQLYLNNSNNSAKDIQDTFIYAQQYLWIMLLSFIPFSLTQSINTTFSETGKTKLPMISSITAVFVNLIGNYLLIFGHFGLPRLGVNGAAIATVISRFVELGVAIYFTRRYKNELSFFRHLFKGFTIPNALAKQITIKGAPLVLNEVLWSTGIACIAQCYSTRGVDAIAAYNITCTIQNLFFVFSIAMGNSISILVGQQLGAGKLEEAMDTDRKLIVFTFLLSICVGLVLLVSAPFFPSLYNTKQTIRQMSTAMLQIYGCLVWVGSIYNACYFTLRCGGKTILTFLFDSVGTLCVSFPIGYCVAHFTNISIVPMFLILQCADLYKVILGLYLVHKKTWVQNLVEKGV